MGHFIIKMKEEEVTAVVVEKKGIIKTLQFYKFHKTNNFNNKNNKSIILIILILMSLKCNVILSI